MRLTPTCARRGISATPTRPKPHPCRRAVRDRRLLIAVTLASALVLLAGAPDASAATVRVVALAGSVDTVLTNVRNWIMGILAGLATVFLTIGGVRYVMAAGDPGEVQKAKIAFKSAGIGYALAALAPLVVTVLQGIVGA
jgi:type IV secretion system pilin